MNDDPLDRGALRVLAHELAEAIDQARRDVEIAILEELIEGTPGSVLLCAEEGSLLEIFVEHDVELDDQLHFVFFTIDVQNKGRHWWKAAIAARQRSVQ